MNKQQLKGNWNVIKGRLKKAYADLTDDDLKHAEGNLDELVGIIQKRVGRQQDEIRREVEDMLRH
ncbi:CsbD family protein [Luteolibacter sp. LG18]|uniref:CsbD family protein n=1 Tax=Luteolibacter sp. LG18 TaxID=2819286 RepID=UPI002B2E025D|nr:CsbD family protein [Luteolibacter sp. LG18]